MKKILVLGPVPPPYGGIASAMEALLNSELRREFNLELFERQSVLPPGYENFWRRNYFRCKRFISYFLQLARNRYDLVHIHSDFNGGFPGTILFMILTRLARTKLLLHLHGTDWHFWHTNRPWIRRARNKAAFRLPDSMIVLYGLWKSQILALIPHHRIHVIGNCIEDSPAPDREAADSMRSELGLGKDQFVVLTVGFVGRRKGALDTLNAAPRVVNKVPNVKFVFIGGEEFPGETLPVVKKIEDDHLEPWVKVVGEVPRSKVPFYLACADVFLLPSRQEGMPIALLEALRAGLPVIVSRVGAMPEMIEDGETGILVDPGDPEAIAEAIKRVMNDPGLRRRLAANGRELFEKKYELRAGIQGIATVYRSMC